VNLEELDQIIDRGMRTPLNEAEGQKLKTALHSMAERLSWKRSTEKTSAVVDQPAAVPVEERNTDEPAPAGHGRHGAAAFTGANRVSIAHATLHAGNRCPECRQGKVYRQKEPATLVRFVGQAPLEATVFEMERLRCNACGQIFTADPPETAGPDKYDETAVAMIALLKYGTGVPFNRLESLDRHVLETLRGVYHNDTLARQQGLSPQDRLRFHREHSGPLMKQLHDWMEAQFAERKTEPNSGLGKAISYLLNHWPKLTLFLQQPGAPLDNNLVERALKKAILNRKNALFYKTLNGAGVGDLFMSLIHTCELNGANPFDYLTELQRHAGELQRNPSEWMPWNYREALARLATPAAA
jgi:hypothetical protein